MKPTFKERAVTPPVESQSNPLLVDNPMLAEGARAINRFTGTQLDPKTRTLMRSLLVAIYLATILLTVAYRSVFPPEVVIILQGLCFCLLTPSIMNSSIVGEREKRSWDMILVAPVTPAQIVVGKFLLGIAVNVMVVAAFLPFVIVTALAQNAGFASVLLAELTTIGFSIALTSFALYASAKSKRILHTQAMVYGTQAAVLIVWPILIAFFQASSDAQTALNFLSPFFLILSVFSGNQHLTDGIALQAILMGLIGYTIITVVCLNRAHAWVERDLHSGT